MNTDMNNIKNKWFSSGRLIMILLAVYDIAIVNISYFAALLIRFDGRYSTIPEIYLDSFKHFAPFYTVLCVIIFIIFKLYNSIWRFASYVELLHLIGATITTSLVQIFGSMIMMDGRRMPLSYYLGGMMCQGAFMLLIRFGYRFIHLERGKGKDLENRTNVLVYGGGSIGAELSRQIAGHSPKQLIIFDVYENNASQAQMYRKP